MLVAVMAVAVGGVALSFSYWWNTRHPTEFMHPRWDTLVLVFLPWGVGMLSLSLGVLLGIGTLLVWLVRKLTHYGDAT